MDQLADYFNLVDKEAFFRSDYPDVDIIRVEDTYYCVTTTMHFFPGGQILSSKDLVHWKQEAYVYDKLDSTPGQCLEDGAIYGKGMWAASIRFHKGTFYVCFVANDTGKTYLYRATSIQGPWQKSTIEGFFHDCSLLFDDDDRVYIIYGNRKIYITELNEDLSAPKEGGLNKLLIEDTSGAPLGFEGTTALKINGLYYFFFIHSRSECWRRVEACYYTDSLTDGELVGGEVCNQDLGYKFSGIAQGCIVDTPEHDWYAILFQDRGAAGRMPVLMPMHFDGKMPVIEPAMELAKRNPAKSVNTGEKLLCKDVFRDDFSSKELDDEWQWNHEPELNLVAWGTETKGLAVTNGKLCDSPLTARNTLTRRLIFPKCSVEVTVDGSQMENGDCAGLCALLGSYGSIALVKENGHYSVEMTDYTAPSRDKEAERCIVRMDEMPGDAIVRFKAEFSFGGEHETVTFFANGKQVGSEKEIFFRLDHFTGCRAALFGYATQQTGGTAVFRDFVWKSE